MSAVSTLRVCMVLSATLLLGSACIIDDVAIDVPDVYTCVAIEDCLSGYKCIDGICTKGVVDTQCPDNDNDGVGAGEGCFGTQDCDDTKSSVFPATATMPAAPEVCDNLDNDCNGTVDDGIATIACPNTTGVCAAAGATQSCVAGELVPADCEEGCPGATCLYGGDYVPTDSESNDTSLCGDGLDNNCDGAVDEGCPTCTVGASCGSGCLVPANGTPVPDAQCACKMGQRTCDGSINDCVDPATDQPVIYFLGQAEISGNGIDDDCNGVID